MNQAHPPSGVLFVSAPCVVVKAAIAPGSAGQHASWAIKNSQRTTV